MLVSGLCAFFMTAFGGEPKPDEFRAYLDEVIDIEVRLAWELTAMARVPILVDDDKIVQARADEVARRIDHAAKRSEKLPAFEGDARLRDSIVGVYRWMEVTYPRTIVTSSTLVAREPPTRAAVAELEEMERRTREEFLAKIALVHAQAVEMAAQNDVTLTVAVEEVPSTLLDDFSAPGLIPEGSELPGSVHASLAVGYHNYLIELHDSLQGHAGSVITALNAGAGSLERVHGTVVKAVEADLRRATLLEDWRGDSQARDATRLFAESLLALLGNEIVALTKLLAERRMTASDVDQANVLVNRLNDTIGRSSEACGAAIDSSAARWHIPEFQQWMTTQLPAQPSDPRSSP